MSNSKALPDVAFQVATEMSHLRAKEELQAKFPAAPWDDIVAAYAKACALMVASEEVAERMRSSGLAEKEAGQLLQAQAPGFAPETYRTALGWALFVTR